MPHFGPEAGFEDSLHQMPLTQYRPRHLDIFQGGVTTAETYGAVFAEANGTRAIFSRRNGGLMSLSKNGREFLAGPARPNFWRAMTDADIGNGTHVRCAVWRLQGEAMKLLSFTTGMEPGRFTANESTCFPSAQFPLKAIEYRMENSVPKRTNPARLLPSRSLQHDVRQYAY